MTKPLHQLMEDGTKRYYQLNDGALRWNLLTDPEDEWNLVDLNDNETHPNLKAVTYTMAKVLKRHNDRQEEAA